MDGAPGIRGPTLGLCTAHQALLKPAVVCWEVEPIQGVAIPGLSPPSADGETSVSLCTEDEGTLCICVVAEFSDSQLKLAFLKLTMSRGEGTERQLVFCFVLMMFICDQ